MIGIDDGMAYNIKARLGSCSKYLQYCWVQTKEMYNHVSFKK